MTHKRIKFEGIPVSAACQGEFCTLCWTPIDRVPATHKVGEEILFDDSMFNLPHHNMTAYICCYHFRSLFRTKGCQHVSAEPD